MKTIAVISGKGGVGKTTAVANIGAALASEFKKRVVLIDGSTITSDLGLHFGIYSPSVSLEDVLKKKVPILEAVQAHVSGVKLLLAPLAPSKAYPDLEELKEFLNELESYELILIDSCSGLGNEIIPILELCDEVLVVTNPELPAITDALKAIEVAKRNKVLVGGVVLNRVRNERYELSVSEIEPFLDARVIAVVPEDAGVREGIASGNPVVLNSPNSPAAIEFKKLAAHLVGEEYIVGFFTRLRNLFRFRRKPGSKAAVKVEEIKRWNYD
ncbi:MAG: cell division ATPase MinD [Methanobacteriota archaeon]